MELARLAQQNPWWRDAALVAEDPHLVRYEQAPVKLVHPTEREVGVDSTGIQVMRGPRQVGKTTLLKRMIGRLIESGTAPRDICYAALDIAGIHAHLELLDLLQGFLRTGNPSGKRYVMLDEITYCPEWATALKAAADLGLLEGVFLLATGSHALDLARGVEKLPGRRGRLEARSDLEMGPYPFSELARALDGGRPQPAASWEPAELFAAAQENAIRFPGIRDTFGVFLAAGGFPRALADLVTLGGFTPETAALHRDAVIGDILRTGRNERHLRDILRAVVLARGTPLSWHGLAERLTSGSKNTVAQYLEALEACYLVQVLPQPASLGTSIPAPRKARKVLFRDPFLGHVFTAWATGAAEAWATASACLADPACTGVVVESAVAGQLLRRFRQLLHWRNSGEIDLIGVTDTGSQALFEVKYQTQVTSGDKKHLKAKGGGVVVSRATLSFDAASRIAVIPVPLLLLSFPSSSP
jgi:predicted AAA+ superfamily ATPase